ncbi:MAG: hypothetical protein A2571_00835 [Candidatus Vogelbacteria bacterium RIFOXYD1_FULL_44_32]|uniref:Uncharacterized protein n=1 Tax=Candidatus Vogelbacteria bacterium RIFOXYD1_FULL_44_32 TaxID=1802438 RepID=A0A1G2QE91_9BACT|nr:MAG: hypothetical protein A2571_00835 [Candidatus Vogelbacteria bacterium RIFOXYD1_FULL_44_32]
MGTVTTGVNPQLLPRVKDLPKRDRALRFGDSLVFHSETHRVLVVRRGPDGPVVVHSADFDGLTHFGFLQYVEQQVYLFGLKYQKSSLVFGPTDIAYDVY